MKISALPFIRAFAIALCLAVAAPVLTFSGCAAPSTRVQEVKTLKVVGLSVDATMKLAAQLYHDGKIGANLWQKIADIHDRQFQPAFNLAVQAVQSDLSSVASPDLAALAAQLAALLAPYLEAKH